MVDRSNIVTESLKPLVRPPADDGGPYEVLVEVAAPVLPVLDGRYALQARLGSGGMAIVWLARDLRLERLVAIKMLHRELATDPNHLERFRREALMLAMIDSPFVVPVYDVVMAPEQCYLVMRYVPGRTLGDEVDARHPFTSQRAATIVLQILEGVRALHLHRLVHRDLKLANVILADDGRPVLVDLGVAFDRRRRILTRPGFIAGTPAAMTPEQKCGSVDERIDIFQAGIILSQLATSRLNVDDEALSRVPELLASVIRAATAPLDQRYRSASEMAAALGVVVRRLGGRET